ncbi:recombinase family protein [Streptomyces chartreusis]
MLDRQIHGLTEAGCIQIFTDKKSGKNAEREELWRALDYLHEGDTLVVPSLDRLGRSSRTSSRSCSACVSLTSASLRGTRRSTRPRPADAWSSACSRPWRVTCSPLSGLGLWGQQGVAPRYAQKPLLAVAVVLRDCAAVPPLNLTACLSVLPRARGVESALAACGTSSPAWPATTPVEDRDDAPAIVGVHSAGRAARAARRPAQPRGVGLVRGSVPPGRVTARCSAPRG